ncbi:hypothetical protein WJX77_006486 [Trebouxia sp. C0004]
MTKASTGFVTRCSDVALRQDWQKHSGQAFWTQAASQLHPTGACISTLATSPSSPGKWHHHSHYHRNTSPSSSQAIPGVATAPASILLQSSGLQSADTHSQQTVAAVLSQPGCGSGYACNEDAKKERPLKQAYTAMHQDNISSQAYSTEYSQISRLSNFHSKLERRKGTQNRMQENASPNCIRLSPHRPVKVVKKQMLGEEKADYISALASCKAWATGTGVVAAAHEDQVRQQTVDRYLCCAPSSQQSPKTKNEVQQHRQTAQAYDDLLKQKGDQLQTLHRQLQEQKQAADEAAECSQLQGQRDRELIKYLECRLQDQEQASLVTEEKLVQELSAQQREVSRLRALLLEEQQHSKVVRLLDSRLQQQEQASIANEEKMVQDLSAHQQEVSQLRELLEKEQQHSEVVKHLESTLQELQWASNATEEALVQELSVYQQEVSQLRVLRHEAEKQLVEKEKQVHYLDVQSKQLQQQLVGSTAAVQKLEEKLQELPCDGARLARLQATHKIALSEQKAANKAEYARMLAEIQHLQNTVFKLKFEGRSEQHLPSQQRPLACHVCMYL